MKSKIQQKLLALQAECDSRAEIVAVSKTKSNEIIMEAYQNGHRQFGENKVQELVQKYESLPKDILWHFIGHLQRNKVRQIAGFVHLVHSVDSLRLLREINKQAVRFEKTIECLLQIKIASEEQKFGLSNEELEICLKEASELSNIKIRGLMGMASYTQDTNRIRNEFTYLKNLFDDLSTRSLAENIEINILSMGMSGDYKLALEMGANMLRLGSSIFGSRDSH